MFPALTACYFRSPRGAALCDDYAQRDESGSLDLVPSRVAARSSSIPTTRSSSSPRSHLQVRRALCTVWRPVDPALTSLYASVFAIIRVYAIWGNSWKPLIVVAPLSMARPILYLVRSFTFLWGCWNLTPTHVHQASNVHYRSVQAGAPFGCTRHFLHPHREIK